MIKLSIITVNRNNAAGLQKTMDSVFLQTFNDYEYIVIDGGSTDDSSTILSNHADKLTYWVREKDNGIFHAMNKGAIRAAGEYLLFLNSGDYLYNDGILEKVFETLPIFDIIYGNVIWEPAISVSDGVFPDTLSFEYFQTYSLPHQASFIRKDLFTMVGPYEESQTIVSDWLFFLLAIYKFNCSYQHIHQTVAVCDTTGISLEPANLNGIVKTRKELIAKHFTAFNEDFEKFYSLRDELHSLRSEFELVKRSTGYRMHMKLRNLLKK